MPPFKIAHFCWESLHSIREGGLSPAVTNLAEALAKTHEVHFFTRGEGPDRVIDGVFYHFCQPEGENILDYCHNMSSQLPSTFHESDSPPFDIIHFHDWHFIDALQELRDRNTVLTYHSTEYGRNGGNFGEWLEFHAISQKEFAGGYLAGHITTVSKQTKTEIMWLYGIPEEKITVVPNGIDPGSYWLRIDPGSVKKAMVFTLSPHWYSLSGGWCTRRDLICLWMPFPRCSTDDGTPSLSSREKEICHSELVERCRTLPVQFTGYISDDEYLRLLNACDLVVIPSRNEPFGLVLTEAWSAERCVVATEIGGLSENIDNFVDGIKVPVRADSIAWAINYIIEDPYRMRAMGLAGKRKVISQFNWKTIRMKMEQVYERVVSPVDDKTLPPFLQRLFGHQKEPQ